MIYLLPVEILFRQKLYISITCETCKLLSLL